MNEFKFGRGRKPFSHNYFKRLRSESSILDETIEEEQDNIQNDFDSESLIEEDLTRTALEPIINTEECSVSPILGNVEEDSFFKYYLMGAKLIQGNNIKVSLIYIQMLTFNSNYLMFSL
jgi:hypothetical protein